MFNVTKVDLWSVPVDDRPGGLVSKLEPMVMAGADLDFLVARADKDSPGGGLVILSPLKGQRQVEAAAQQGFRRNDQLYCLHVEGADEPGALYRILRSLAQDALNLQEVAASTSAGQFAAYLVFETAEAADKAAQRLQRPL